MKTYKKKKETFVLHNSAKVQKTKHFLIKKLFVN